METKNKLYRCEFVDPVNFAHKVLFCIAENHAQATLFFARYRNENNIHSDIYSISEMTGLFIGEVKE